MAITTFDGYIAAAKQKIAYTKTTTRVTIASSWFSLLDIAGQPGAGTLNAGNTANGLVPTDATSGFPLINNFAGGAKGYLGVMDFGNSVAARMMLFDRLFHAGAYAFNANTTLTAQPSFSGRVPGGTDFTGCELWIECVTAFTGNPTITITYTNQSGTAGKSTGAIALGLAPTLGRMIQMPLAAGDTGVQKIESVVCTVATVGTFNVLVIRPFWTGRVKIANDGDMHGLDRIGMPELFDSSALQIAVNADSTSSGIPDFLIEIVSG
jgi:hypothetical protein